MIEFDRIRNPRYADTSKTIIKFDIVTGENVTKVAQLTVPENKSDNAYYEYIIDTFGAEFLDEGLAARVAEQETLIERDRLRAEAEVEAAELRALFNLKAESFKLPWIKNASEEVVGAVRRAQSPMILQSLVAAELHNYMSSNTEVTFSGLMDEIDTWFYEE